MVLRFNIQPAVKSCYQGCHLNTSKIARRVADLVDSFAFIIWDVNRQALYVDQLPAVYTWTGQYRVFLSSNFNVARILRTFATEFQQVLSA